MSAPLGRRASPGSVEAAVTSPAAGIPRHAWFLAAVFVAAVAFQLGFFDRWLALLDEGYVLAIADDVRRGKVLYRDIHVDAPFPAAFHLLAWWYAVAGVSVRASRWLVVLGFATFATALARLAAGVLPVRGAVAFAVVLLVYRVFAFPHWHIYSYSLVSATFAALAAVGVLRAMRRASLLAALVAGALAGASIAAKQDYGVGVTATLGLALLLRPWLDPGCPRVRDMLVPAATFAVGPVVVVGLVVAWFTEHGALSALIDQTIRFPLSAVQGAPYATLPTPWPLFTQDTALRAQIGNYFPSIMATVWWNPCPGCFVSGLGTGAVWRNSPVWDVTIKAIFWLPIVVFPLAAAAFVLRVLRGRRGAGEGATPDRLVALALAGGFLLAFNKPRDWVHLMMVYPPQLLLAASLLADAARRVPPAARRVLLGVAAVGGAALVAVALALVADLRRTVTYPLSSPRAGVYADPLNGPVIEQSLAWVHAVVPADAPLLVLPTHPMLGFLAGHEAPGGYHVVWPLQGAERDARILSAVDDEHIQHALYSVSQWGHIRFEDDAPGLFRALVERFEIAEVFSPVAFGPVILGLQRRSAGEGTPLRTLVPQPDGAAWDVWPFDHVLTHAVATAGAPSSVEVRTIVPVGRPVLRLAYGTNPDRWLGTSTGPVDLTLTVTSASMPTPRTLAAGTLDPRARVEDRRWNAVEADLSASAGEPVTLTFSATAKAPIPIGFAGWREPVFVASP